MFNRLILKQLLSWKASPGRKPLILRGARQVGKTTLVNLFSKQFKHYIYLNLDQQQDAAVFEYSSVDEVISAIFFKHQLPKDVIPDTLLFIDEIQSKPEAVAMLRYIYEQYPGLATIGAGSLLESLIDIHTSFPVGRVTFLELFPFNFEEYLMAQSQHEMCEMLGQTALPSYAHDALSESFYRYASIGGMPEIIKDFVEHQDYVRLNTLFHDLLKAYENDVEKYVKSSSKREVIRHTITRAPFEAAKRIRFEGFGSSHYGSQAMKDALLMLEKAMLLRLIYPTVQTTLPLMPNFTRSPKLQYLDTGLVNAAVGLTSTFLEHATLDSIYQGRIAEHIVGQQLMAQGYIVNQTLGFWVRDKNQSAAEVDFVVQLDGKLIPIEVKSGKTGRLKSLHLFMDAAQTDIAVRVHDKPFSVDTLQTPAGRTFTLFNIPFYGICKLEQYLPI